ncbi:MAG TPA: aldo/keto reductase [Methylomirabilota bacterium]|nr:aldo/keto reductase [Methylomirabilota bacterium]
MAAHVEGHATPAGTARYAARVAGVAPEHFRTLPPEGLHVSTVGIGTYLGREDDATDALYRRAVSAALARGVNVVDTAINYRHQRSERAIGAALAEAVARGELARDEVVVATKGGFIPFDGQLPADPGAYFTATYLRPGIVKPGDVAAGSHCMAPRYLSDQIDRSRRNLGLATIDLYYVHNPESQLGEVARPVFEARLREAFAALEAAVAEGRIRAYGTATWHGYRRDPSDPDYLSLPDVVALARAVGGEGHHFRVIQLPYNLAMPEAFTRANQRADGGLVPVLEAARRLGVYTMASASVYQGQLTRGLPPVVAEYLPGLGTDAQRALQFVRSTPGIGTALVGMKSGAHVDENAGVAAVPPLPWAQFQRLFSEA